MLHALSPIKPGGEGMKLFYISVYCKVGAMMA